MAAQYGKLKQQGRVEHDIGIFLIESLYLQDPDKYMYWPIFQYNLDANPALENYSWYGK